MTVRILLFCTLAFFNDNPSEVWDACCGKCVGAANCTACTSCNYCKYCNSGGSCGVCGGGRYSAPIPYYPGNTSPRVSSPKKYNRSSVPSTQYFVGVNFLNVRSGPNATYPIIDRIYYLTPVKIGASNNGWCHIYYYKDYLRDGYVLERYLAAR